MYNLNQISKHVWLNKKKINIVGEIILKKAFWSGIGKKLISLISYALKEFHIQWNLCFGTPLFSPGEVLGFLLLDISRWPLRAPTPL